jgi:hypothetical protein
MGLKAHPDDLMTPGFLTKDGASLCGFLKLLTGRL